jgi:hypothetical protein
VGAHLHKIHYPERPKRCRSVCVMLQNIKLFGATFDIFHRLSHPMSFWAWLRRSTP